MNVLIVTHSYAPDPRPRAFRWTAIAEAWAAQGHRVDVVTTGRRGGATHERISDVHLHLAGERLIGLLAEDPGKVPPDHARSGTGTAPTGGALRSLAKMLHDHTWKRLYWPDYACLWYLPAFREAIQLCRSRQYDCVITVSHPFTGHLVGRKLKRTFPGLRWIADMGDPFSADSTVPSNNPVLYNGLNRRAENAVLGDADAITVTVEGCRRLFIDDFAIDPEKIHVIPPLLSLAAEPEQGPAPFEKNGSIDLVYLGVLYAAIRRPDAVLALFSALRTEMGNIRLHFVGDIQGCDDAFARFPDLIGTSLFRHGPVARTRVAATMAASDALINIGNDTAHQLPSKLVEYVAAGRPIINVVAKETDTSVDFLKDYARALTIICPDHSLTDVQVEQVRQFLTDASATSNGGQDSIIDKFRLDAISGAYENIALEK